MYLTHDRKIVSFRHLRFISPYSFRYLQFKEKIAYYLPRDIMTLSQKYDPINLNADFLKSLFRCIETMGDIPFALIPDFNFFYVISGLLQKTISLIYILDQHKILEDYLIVMLLIFPIKDKLNKLITEICEILGYLKSPNKITIQTLSDRLFNYMEKNKDLNRDLTRKVAVRGMDLSFIDIFKHNTSAEKIKIHPYYFIERLLEDSCSGDAMQVSISIDGNPFYLEISIEEITHLLYYIPCPVPAALTIKQRLNMYIPPHYYAIGPNTININNGHNITIGYQNPYQNLYQNESYYGLLRYHY